MSKMKQGAKQKIKCRHDYYWHNNVLLLKSETYVQEVQKIAGVRSCDCLICLPAMLSSWCHWSILLRWQSSSSLNTQINTVSSITLVLYIKSQLAAANCTELPTANAGQYAISNCKLLLFLFLDKWQYTNVRTINLQHWQKATEGTSQSKDGPKWRWTDGLKEDCALLNLTI